MPSYRQIILAVPHATAPAMKGTLVELAKTAINMGGVVKKFENKGLRVSWL